MTRIRSMLETVVFYPVTTIYLVGVFVAVGISYGRVNLGLGLLVLSGLFVAVLLVATLREVRVVHHLVNSQRDALLARISDLIDALNEAGIELPEREKKDTGAKT